MHAYVYPSRHEKVISGAFAFGMHVVFLVLLAFGVTWQKRVEPQANIVDLWANLPSPAPPKVELPLPKPALKLEVKPPEPPPVKPVAKPEIAKPDIALKEKAEKERRALEEKNEAKKKEAEAKAAQKRQQEEEAEAKRLAREQVDALRKFEEQRATEQVRLRNVYIDLIRSSIRQKIIPPPNLQGNPDVAFEVIQIPGGEVIRITLVRASGNAAWDDAVERAIKKASPLPRPPKPELFDRKLDLSFRPKE